MKIDVFWISVELENVIGGIHILLIAIFFFLYKLKKLLNKEFIKLEEQEERNKVWKEEMEEEMEDLVSKQKN